MMISCMQHGKISYTGLLCLSRVGLDLMQTIASTPVLSTVAGKRHYIVAYGDQKGDGGLRSTQAVLIEPPVALGL